MTEKIIRPPDSDSERPHPGQQEPQAQKSHVDLLRHQVETLRTDPNYCEWNNGEVTSKYLDINWLPVELDMPLLFNRKRQLSLAQLDVLARMDRRDVAHCYQNNLVSNHFELIEQYRRTCYPETKEPRIIQELAIEPPTEQEKVDESAAPEVAAVEITGVLGATDDEVLEQPAVEKVDSVLRLTAAVSLLIEMAAELGFEEPAPVEETLPEPPEILIKSVERPEFVARDQIEVIAIRQAELPNAEPIKTVVNILPVGVASDATKGFVQPAIKQIWVSGKEMIQSDCEALRFKLADWRENHLEKVWAASFVSAALVAVSALIVLESENQPASAVQPEAVIAEADDSESVLDIGLVASVNLLDEVLQLPAVDLSDYAVAKGDTNLPPSANYQALPTTRPLAQESLFLNIALPAREISLETTKTAESEQANEVQRLNFEQALVFLGEVSQQVVEVTEPLQLAKTELVVQAENQAVVDELPAPVVSRPTTSLNIGIINRQLNSVPANNIPQPVVAPEPTPAVQSTAEVQQPESVAPQPAPVEVLSTPSATLTAEQSNWLVAAGIPETNWYYVDYIFTRESSWRPYLWSSVDVKSFGLCQANLLVHEVPESYMTDPVTQIQWCDAYAHRRYGGWKQAFEFWKKNHWW